MDFRKRTGHRYTNRGHISVYSFVLDDLVLGDTWQDLDLSPFIGTGIKLVKIFCMGLSNGVNSKIEVRQKGLTNAFNIDELRVTDTSLPHTATLEVMTDATGKIQYLIPNINWTAIIFTIRGYFS